MGATCQSVSYDDVGSMAHDKVGKKVANVSKLHTALLDKWVKRGRGNPYAIVKVGGGWGVKNTEKGNYHSKGISRKKAIKQFRLLEGIEHGWTPTRSR